MNRECDNFQEVLDYFDIDNESVEAILTCQTKKVTWINQLAKEKKLTIATTIMTLDLRFYIEKKNG